MPAVARRHGEVQQVQPVLVEFVDHEPDDAVVGLGDHADAVPLPQALEEILLRPGELEAPPFGLEHLGHIAADHPADVDS